MITEFSLDEGFFSSSSLKSESLSAVHDFVTNAWLNFGVMILPEGGEGKVMELIDTLPNKFRQRWVEAFEYGKSSEVRREWWDFSSYNNFDDLCELSRFFKTAFSEDDVSYILCGDESYRRICRSTGFEILGAGVCSESENLARASSLASSDILEVDGPEDVWNSRFKGLALYSKKITIIDRYFFQGIWRSAERQVIDEALKNFFMFLSRLNRKFNIKIISYGDVRNSDFHSAVYQQFYRGIYKVPALSKSINSLTLVSSSEDFFKRESHDRFIGFDRHVCQVGNGMRVLGAKPIPRSTFLAKFDRDGELSKREISSCSRGFKLWEERL